MNQKFFAWLFVKSRGVLRRYCETFDAVVLLITYAWNGEECLEINELFKGDSRDFRLRLLAAFYFYLHLLKSLLNQSFIYLCSTSMSKSTLLLKFPLFWRERELPLFDM